MTDSSQHDSFTRTSARMVGEALSGMHKAGADRNAAPDPEPPNLWHFHDEKTGLAVATPDALFVAKFGEIGLPEIMVRCSFENWRALSPQHAEIGRSVAQWAKNAPEARPKDAGHSLFLAGPTRCGKSHLAVSALRTLVGSEHRARYYDAPLLMTALRAAWGDDDLSIYIDPEVLFLDNLALPGTELQLERFRIILTQRLDNRRITILTSKFSINSREAEKLLGPDLRRRIERDYAVADLLLPDFRSQTH